jgi:hypothetical protein
MIRSPRCARGAGLPLEWAETQRCLAMLTNHQASLPADAGEAAEVDLSKSDPTEAALAIAKDVFQQAKVALHRALRDPGLADAIIDDSIHDVGQVERLCKIIEEETPGLDGPVGDRAVLWRVGLRIF